MLTVLIAGSARRKQHKNDFDEDEPMKLQDLLNSRLGVGFALFASQVTPPAAGYSLAHWLGDRVADRKDSQIVRAVRANQWVVHDGNLTSQQLDELVRATFRSTGISLFDFYHYHRRPEKVAGMVDFDPSFQYWFERGQREVEGIFFVVPHMSNFDLVGRAVVLRGLKLHILSFPQPPRGYRWQNRIRQLPGLRISPLSIDAIRQASDTLRAKQVLVTGVDRPLPNPDSKYMTPFFGRPAPMPVFHIRLALKHNLPIIVLSGCRQENGRYLLRASEPIEMQRRADLVEETVTNAETVLAHITEFIRAVPEQWSMFYPVWPESLETMPA
jgi:KDO2-lipid IV(A) lauroyltransferase